MLREFESKAVVITGENKELDISILCSKLQTGHPFSLFYAFLFLIKCYLKSVYTDKPR